MIRWLPLPLACVVTFAIMVVWLCLWVPLVIFPGILIKFLMPTAASRRTMTRALVWAGQSWSRVNGAIYRLLLPMRWQVELPAELDPRRSYLLICNHQSWADILILFHVLYGYAPWPRFFMKRELIWVPLIGPACWGMDFPFMKRHSHQAIARNPQLARDDLETTRRFCERFRGEPITVVNFLDGTRVTDKKRLARKSPFRHLLRPKSAGLSFTMNAMGEQFAGLLDVTICYQPSRAPTLWSLLGGRQPEIVVKAQLRSIDPEWLHSDYQGDAAFRERFQEQVNALWAEKDAQLEQLKKGRGRAVADSRKAGLN